METVNSTSLESTTFPFFVPEKGNVLAIILKGSFKFDSGRSVFSEDQLPIFYGDEFVDPEKGGSVKFESDLVPFKPRCDIVVAGKAYAPGGNPLPFFDVSLKVGKLEKQIRAIGDRGWKYSDSLIKEYDMIEPEPISEMELIYENAFGGIDLEKGGYCPENPLGKGYVAPKSKKAVVEVSLPNLEDPENLIASHKDYPKPVGFGFYGRACEPRLSLLGTYDETWRKERSPLPPEDFSSEFHNGAHPDLQVEGYLKGDEEVVLTNLIAGREKASFELPGVYPVCQALKQEEKDVKMNLDTLCLIPDEARFYLVWRGVVPIKELDDWGINKLTIGLKGE